MTWLVQEIWLWMALAALAGALLTGFFSTTEIRTERWVPTPVPDEAPAEAAETLGTQEASPRAEDQDVLASPFPEFQATSGPRPWEEDELWTRPVAEGTSADTALVPLETTDEWDEAADSWRGWAGEITAEPRPEPEVVTVHAEEPAEEPQLVEGAEPAVEPVAVVVEEPVEEPVAEVVAEVADEQPAEAHGEAPVPGAETDDAGSEKATEVVPNVEVEAQVEAQDELETVAPEVAEAEVAETDETAPPTEELSPAEKIRIELARLEAEMAKREQRRLELLEAERTGYTAPDDPVEDQAESAGVAPVAPVKKARRRSAPEQQPEVLDQATEPLTSEEATSEEATPEQAEAERLEAERLAAEKAARNKARAQRAAATRAARKQAAAQAEAERAEAERVEAERVEAERAEAERVEAERLAAEKARLKAERAAAARARAKAKREEAARLKAEQDAAEEEQVEALREAAEQVEAEQVEAEQVEAEQRDQRVPADGTPVSGLAGIDPADNSEAWKQGPFGPGSAYAAFDGTAPRGYTIKANVTTKLYHSRSSRFYSRTQADVWFQTEEHAEAAGFTRWDRRGTMAHATVQGEAVSEGPAA